MRAISHRNHPPAGDLVKASPNEALVGLLRPPRYVPCKYFYDARGSALFDRICELEEYYLTRTELSIMREHIDEITDLLGPRCLLVEYGSGSSLKTRILLDNLEEPAGYVPIDISRDHLLASVAALSRAYPDLDIVPVCADYTGPLTLPRSLSERRSAIYFPGSTIGNFEPKAALQFLERMAKACGKGGALLIGVDLQKDHEVIEAAYNDAAGVTAEFNKNILYRLNREFSSSFDVDAFEHVALYNSVEGRIEMFLESRCDQSVRVDGHHITLRSGERICTEYSYKYTLDGFAELAAGAGFSVECVWTDAKDYFSVQYLVAE